MNTNGIDHMVIETYDWEAGLAFWGGLGYEIEHDTGHRSGMLRNPAGGPGLFLREQSMEEPLGFDLYLSTASAAGFVVPANAVVVRPFTDTHWGTKVMSLRDPDGRLLRIEAPE